MKQTKEKKIAVNIRVDMHLLNKLHQTVLDEKKTLSKVIREIIEKS
jgi:predicted DNA binding CopG/RHH family protein